MGHTKGAVVDWRGGCLGNEMACSGWRGSEWMSLETNLEVWALIERKRTRMVAALEIELDKER